MANELSQGGVELVFDDRVCVDKDDALAVAVSQAEEYMGTRIDENVEAAAAASKEATKEREALAKILAEDAKTQMKPAADAFEAAVRLVAERQDEVKVDVSASSISSRHAEEVTFDYTATLRVSFDRTSISVSRELLAPEAAIEKSRQIEALLEEASKRNAEAMEWKKRLANIGSYERKAKANLAKHRLSKSEAGRELLTALTANVENDVKRLSKR